MSCGGCAKRGDVLRGLMKKASSGTYRPQQAAQRVGVVTKHAARDLLKKVATPISPLRRRGV